MGIQTDRAAIAAALDTVDGVEGHQYRPRTPKPGDAWPTLPTLTRDQGIVWRPEWTVVVFLPQDERKASEWLDSHALLVIAALQSQTPLFPESAEPAVMATSAGDQFVLEITGRSH
jgi:hypothetical protein